MRRLSFCFAESLCPQLFLGYVEQSESWLSSKEAFLANEDLGVGTLSPLNWLLCHFLSDCLAYLFG